MDIDYDSSDYNYDDDALEMYPAAQRGTPIKEVSNTSMNDASIMGKSLLDMHESMMLGVGNIRDSVFKNTKLLKRQNFIKTLRRPRSRMRLADP